MPFAALITALLLASSRPVARPAITGSELLAPGLGTRLIATVDSSGSPSWRIGLAVVSCMRDSLIFGYNAQKPMVPASNQKLLVTTCALESWNDTLVRELDTLLDRAPLRVHIHRANRAKTDSLGLNDHPELPGYRHLVLANRESNNDEAEWLLAWLTRHRRLDAQTLLGRHLDRNRVPRPGMRVWDGCGLGRRNRLAPVTLAALLDRTLDSRQGALFHSTLAVPGRPGTLVNRKLDVGARLAAKTGFIRDVFSLSGYLAAETDTYAFSFIINGCGSGTLAYECFNALLNTLDNWDRGRTTGCRPASGPGSEHN